MLILIAYFYIMVYRETRKHKRITTVTVLVKTKLENRVAMTCALTSAAVILSFVPTVTVGLLGDLYPDFRKSSVFRSAETLLQMNSLVNSLSYFYRNRRFRNIILEILCIRKPYETKPTDLPMQYVRSKDLSSMGGTKKQPNAYSRRLLSRSESCELANVTVLSSAMKKRSVSATSLIRSHSNSFESPGPPNNPSSILTALATVHPQRLEGYFSIFRLSSPKNSNKSWDAKRNSFNVSDPPEDLKKEQFSSNNTKVNKRLTKSATLISGAEGTCGFTSASLAIAILKQVVACSKLEDSEEIRSRKVARKPRGGWRETE